MRSAALQLSGFLVVLWDERPIKLPTAEDEALWRCFYRRCGMTRVAFLQVRSKDSHWATPEGAHGVPYMMWVAGSAPRRRPTGPPARYPRYLHPLHVSNTNKALPD